MPTTFRPYQPKPKLLLPPDIRDWLPEDHLVHHVSDLVDGLDLTAFHTPYEGDGRRKAPYEPPRPCFAANRLSGDTSAGCAPEWARRRR